MRLYPRLLHPVVVVVEQIDKASTVYDEDTREPVYQASRHAAVSLPGQASYGSSKERSYAAYGPSEDESGYITFLMRDLTAQSVRLCIGDRISKIGNVDHDAYINKLQPMGHYPEFGATLMRAYFQDRQPVKLRSA